MGGPPAQRPMGPGPGPGGPGGPPPQMNRGGPPPSMQQRPHMGMNGRPPQPVGGGNFRK